MSKTCPKCGASVIEDGSNSFECGTYTFYGVVCESPDCLRSQLDQANEKLNALLSERMDEAEAKIGTRPAHVVVRELQAENERLRRERETTKKHLREAADYCAMGSPMLARSELAKSLALLEGGGTDGVA